MAVKHLNASDWKENAEKLHYLLSIKHDVITSILSLQMVCAAHFAVFELHFVKVMNIQFHSDFCGRLLLIFDPL